MIHWEYYYWYESGLLDYWQYYSPPIWKFIYNGVDKMMAICPNFKWLGFRISDPIWNPEHLLPNLFSTIQNPDSLDFQIPLYSFWPNLQNVSYLMFSVFILWLYLFNLNKFVFTWQTKRGTTTSSSSSRRGQKRKHSFVKGQQSSRSSSSNAEDDFVVRKSPTPATPVRDPIPVKDDLVNLSR